MLSPFIEFSSFPNERTNKNLHKNNSGSSGSKQRQQYNEMMMTEAMNKAKADEGKTSEKIKSEYWKKLIFVWSVRASERARFCVCVLCHPSQTRPTVTASFVRVSLHFVAICRVYRHIAAHWLWHVRSAIFVCRLRCPSCWWLVTGNERSVRSVGETWVGGRLLCK